MVIMQAAITAPSTQTFNQYLKAVEEIVKQSEDYPTENLLWQKLSQSQHQSPGQRRPIGRAYLKHVLKHLEFENKIMYGKNHVIIWIAADETQKKILKEKFTPV